MLGGTSSLRFGFGVHEKITKKKVKESRTPSYKEGARAVHVGVVPGWVMLVILGLGRLPETTSGTHDGWDAGGRASRGRGRVEWLQRRGAAVSITKEMGNFILDPDESAMLGVRLYRDSTVSVLATMQPHAATTLKI
jgi:hypothetical protein